jgi:hypothetical protein
VIVTSLYGRPKGGGAKNASCSSWLFAVKGGFKLFALLPAGAGSLGRVRLRGAAHTVIIAAQWCQFIIMPNWPVQAITDVLRRDDYIQ